MVAEHLLDCDECLIEQDYEAPYIHACPVLVAMERPRDASDETHWYGPSAIAMAKADEVLREEYLPGMLAELERPMFGSDRWSGTLLGDSTNRDEAIELRLNAIMDKRFPEEEA